MRRIQSNILMTYENDFSKHAPANEVPRIRMVWHSITSQLAKENRKFIYGVLRQGARVKDFEVAMEWLQDAGLGHKVNCTMSGAMTEQYVCQQLIGEVDSLYYWSADNSRGEIDFLIQKDDKIIPVEVKARKISRQKVFQPL